MTQPNPNSRQPKGYRNFINRHPKLGDAWDMAGDYRGVAKFTGGASYVLAAAGFADIGRLADDAVFVHVMTDVKF